MTTITNEVNKSYHENPMTFKAERFFEINGGMKKCRDRDVLQLLVDSSW